ncbi:MAG TPA: endonuclease/exonuclease/phosphatase family protein [Gemmatimonadaceae bacterium]|nr:endonuclease/exonuclease/phosphatase family protein [Gemmatimonadaceae bacterium]
MTSTPTHRSRSRSAAPTRRAAALLLAFALAACSSAPAARPAGGAPAPRGAMRVLTYNIHAGTDAAGADNIARVADLVRAEGADIVLLQEVDRLTTRSGRVDQIGELARRTGLHAAFGRTLDYQGGEYGIAVLSRWPIVRDTLVHLPITPPQQRAGGSYEPRGALHVVIARGGDTLHVVNTHLDASRDDHYRRQEAAALAGILGGIARGGGTVIAGGDLNSTPDAAILPIIGGAGVRDAWAGCGDGDGFSFPASAPVRRIDYLLLPGGMRCVRARVLDSEASDHRAVLFELERA